MRARVLVVMPLGNFGGGAEKMLHTYLKSRRDREAIQIYLLFLSPGKLAETARNLGYPTKVIDAGRLREIWRVIFTQYHIHKLLIEWKIDRVLLWMAKANAYALLPSVFHRIPVYEWRHDIPEPLKVRDKIRLRYLPPAAVACSSNVAGRAFEKSTGGRVHVETIYPGTDMLAHSEDRVKTIRLQIGAGDGCMVLGTVARLQPWKRIDLFLRAAALIKEKYPSLRVVVVGGESHGLSDGYGNELRALGRSLLGTSVYFAGEQENVGDWLQAIDVFVLPSHQEPFGIVLIEALAAGKPVIACSGGGPDEVIDERTIGKLLVENPSPSQMAESICSLMKGEQLEMAKRENPRRFEHFSASSMASRIDQWIGQGISLDEHFLPVVHA